MTLEQEIKQKRPFADPYQKAYVNFVYTNNWLASHMHAFFSSKGITQKQFNIMRILKGAGKAVSTCYIKGEIIR